MPAKDLSRLLTPRSVAIVGATEKPGALGKSVLDNLLRHGFPGDIHLINPKRDTIDGRPCLASIEDLPDGVDAAVLAIPGGGVLDALTALAARKVGAAVIFSAGFAEGGADGMAAQAEIARIARDGDMVVEGPNCIGMTNYRAATPLTFVEAPRPEPGERPLAGIVSQSGAMAVVLATTLVAKGIDISISVSTGNEAATGVEDYVDYLLGTPDTRVIGMVVEQFRTPARFLALAARARADGRTIVLLHPGTSDAGRESAATHSGAMAGDWQLMKLKVTRAGVILVDSLEELGDVIDIVAHAPPMRSGDVAMLTESGAVKALALDVADRIGLAMPPMGDATAAAMRAAIPDFVAVSNPMDLTAQPLIDPDMYRRTLAPLVADPAYAAVVIGIIQTDAVTCERKIPHIVAAVRELAPTKPVIFAGIDDGAQVPPAHIASLRSAGVSYFPTADRAFRAIARIADARASDIAVSDAPPIAIAVAAGVIPEYRAKALLAPIGIPFPRGGFATGLEEAKRVAAAIGYPVALKAQAAALGHKSDAGGVILNIADEPALALAWARLHADVAAYDGTIALDGALVETMGARGIELFVGARNDPEWGPVILVGFGGVAAELFHDVRLLPTDLTRAAILAELRRLKSAPLLDGFRGARPLDVDALADIIGLVGRLLAGTPQILEIDLNPVVVYPEGHGAVALDALILAGR